MTYQDFYIEYLLIPMLISSETICTNYDSVDFLSFYRIESTEKNSYHEAH